MLTLSLFSRWLLTTSAYIFSWWCWLNRRVIHSWLNPRSRSYSLQSCWPVCSHLTWLCTRWLWRPRTTSVRSRPSSCVSSRTRPAASWPTRPSCTLRSLGSASRPAGSGSAPASCTDSWRPATARAARCGSRWRCSSGSWPAPADGWRTPAWRRPRWSRLIGDRTRWT